MKYPDGQEVMVGDRVQLGKDDRGVVVCSLDAKQFTDAYPEAQWGYLKNGVMIEFPLYGLIHYIKPERELKLIARKHR
jgi:hypothetical protein